MPRRTSAYAPLPVSSEKTDKVERITKPLLHQLMASPGDICHTDSLNSTEVWQLPSPQSNSPPQKRKRSQSDTALPIKRARLIPGSCIETTAEREEETVSYRDADIHVSEINWADYFGAWPPMDSRASSRTGRRGSGKRPHSLARSYSNKVRAGHAPAPWSPGHEELMFKAGLVMNEHQTEAVVSADCQKLCDSLLGAKVTIPTGTMFSSDRLLKILELVRFRSEARIYRDVTPLLVPSPELLYIDGHDSLEHVREAIDAEWTNCEPICGPQPKPDLTIGIAATAFTDEEIETMRLNCLHTCEILPSERIYCPFLICEAKGNRGTIEEADRQGMHAASIAVLSIVQLFTNISAIDEVDGRILAFSVSHNKEIVKIFGHFAVVRDGSPRYFRRRVFVTDFAEDVAAGQWHKTYGVVSAIYKNFYPQHLARIKSALSRSCGQPLGVGSFTSLENDSQQSTIGFSTSREESPVKRTASVREGKEITTLRQQLKELQELQAAQKADMQKQITNQQEMIAELKRKS